MENDRELLKELVKGHAELWQELAPKSGPHFLKAGIELLEAYREVLTVSIDALQRSQQSLAEASAVKAQKIRVKDKAKAPVDASTSKVGA